MQGSIFFYENMGTPVNHNFILISYNFENISVSSRSAIDFIDFDYDQDLDLFVGSQSDGIFVFENIGTAEIPDFIIFEDLYIPMLGLNNVPALYHDNGKINMLTGISTGGAYCLIYESCILLGDLNGNTYVDIVDIIFLINIILSDLPYESLCSPDFNNDANIDVLDVILLVDIVLD